MNSIRLRLQDKAKVAPLWIFFELAQKNEALRRG
jgi:hypothetical protein